MSRNRKVIKLDAEIVRMLDRIAELEAEVQRLIEQRNSIHQEGMMDEGESLPPEPSSSR